MLDTVVAAALQDVAKTHQVGLDVGGGILQGIPHPRLGGEVHHSPGLGGRKQSRHRLAIGEIQAMETPKPLASCAWERCRRSHAIEPIQPRLL